MDKQPITSQEANGLRTAVGFMTAGEAAGVPDATVNLALEASDKLAAAPRDTIWVPFSRMELLTLWQAITNGAEGVLQPASGMRRDQKQAFRHAANRIADAGAIDAPRF
jgi:hypothetical protein